MATCTETPSNALMADFNLEKLHKMATEPAKIILRQLNTVLVFTTNLLAKLLGSTLVKHQFHLVLSALVLFGPALSFWVSKHSIFAHRHQFLYRKFLLSAWGWTCVFAGSFVLLVCLSARCSLLLALRHLSRVAAAGALLAGCRRLLMALENAAGTCYEPLVAAGEGGPMQGSGVSGQPLLLLHEDRSKASCLKAGMVWRGYEVSEDTLILCLCCLLLVEEMSIYGPYMAQVKPLEGSPQAPLRIIFLLCVFLLVLWMFLLMCLLSHFTQFPSQSLGGAVGYLGWRGLYQGWYRFKPNWGCPGLPGEGFLYNTDDNKLSQL